MLDYKATAVKRSIDEDLQLTIYLIAREDAFDTAVRMACYVYVGEVGPIVDLRTSSEGELAEALMSLSEQLQRAAGSGFAEYTVGRPASDVRTGPSRAASRYAENLARK